MQPTDFLVFYNQPTFPELIQIMQSPNGRTSWVYWRSSFYKPDAVPVSQPTVLEHWTGPWFNPHPSGPHYDGILVCYELPPLRWFPSLTSPCWLCSSNVYTDDLALS